MHRRDRLENSIAGTPTDRIPGALWRHFPGDDQRAADFAHSVVAFQRTYDWDMVVIHPSSTYQVTDYGVVSVWANTPGGDRTVTQPTISRSLAWTDLRKQDPQRGERGKVLEVIRMVTNALADDLDPPPVLLTIYNPLIQAAHMAGATLLRRHMRTRIDRLRSGLNAITETTLAFIEALKRTPIAGICYVTGHADYDQMSEAEYSIFGVPYDRKILAELPDKWWLNILSVQGDAPMFQLIQDYPVQAIQWRISPDTPDIPQGKSLIRGAVCGGIGARDTLLTGSPNEVRETCRNALTAANRRRLILSAEGALPTGTPLSNIRAVRGVIESTSGGI